jgi:hypothetical protein
MVDNKQEHMWGQENYILSQEAERTEWSQACSVTTFSSSVENYLNLF